MSMPIVSLTSAEQTLGSISGVTRQKHISKILQAVSVPIMILKHILLLFCPLYLLLPMQVCGLPGVLPCLSPHPSIPADENTCPTHSSIPTKGQNATPSLFSSLHLSSLSHLSSLFSSPLCIPRPISSTAPVPGLRKEPFPTLSLSQRSIG